MNYEYGWVMVYWWKVEGLYEGWRGGGEENVMGLRNVNGGD